MTELAVAAPVLGSRGGTAQGHRADARHARAADCAWSAAGEGTLLNTLPQLVPRRLVPLAGNDASLVSGNERIHTYDFTTGLSTVPICVTCGTRAVTSLQEVLSDPGSHLSYGDSRLGWWMLGATRSTSRAPWRSTIPSRSARWSSGYAAAGPGLKARTARRWHAGRFCAVTVRGSAARVMIRDWIDMPLAKLEAKRRGMVCRPRHGQRQPGERAPTTRCGCWSSAAGRWIPDRDGPGGRYADLGARNLPPPAGHRPAAASRCSAPGTAAVIGARASCDPDPRRPARRCPARGLAAPDLDQNPHQHTEVPMAGLEPGQP